MSSHPRRLVVLSFNGPKLVLCIAFGVWLGITAASLTAWYAYKALYSAPPSTPVAAGPVIRPEPPVTYTPQPDASAPLPAPNAPAPTPGDSDNAVMFDQYQKNLRNQQLNQAEQEARTNPLNKNNAKCQFWLQQAQTAPTEKSRENVAQLCQ
ncbi:hypothetical protein [Pseudomonas sp. dw_358]|uniref:hypothetical protein n=1 Tax=Pseudomonas sp. dw_358 TaxID=2720083 RepID=UPI002116C8A2|nr:hypothetical protein [Pseudomonas sp. dw_358]